MKKSLQKCVCSLIVMLGIIFVLPGCKDKNEDNGPAFSPDGKRLVRKITGRYEKFPDNKDEITYSYNGDGRIIAIDIAETYRSEENGKIYTDVEHATFSVSGKELKVIRNYNDPEYPEDSDTYSGTYLLNEDGYVESGEEKDEDEDVFTYRCRYDDNRYLIRFDYTRNNRDEGPIDFIWKDGNIAKGVYNHTYTYYDRENKANLDFCEAIAMEFMLGYDRSYLGLTGYLGKTNKHLVKESFGGGYIYTYDCDQEGYVVKVTVSSKYQNDEGDYTCEVSYN